MTEGLKILGIIPAREGSKRVPQKNCRPFAGTTLTDLAIQQAQGSRLISTVALSSNSETILSIGRKYQGVFVIDRPKDISGDLSPAIDYVRHALAQLEVDVFFDMVVILQPSSPLRSSADIDATIRLLMENPSADSAVSVVKVAHMIHPLKLKVLEGKELLPFIEDEKGRFAFNELPDVYVRNCAVYVTWRQDLESRQDVIGKKSLGYAMAAETSVDINEMIDFDFAELLFNKHFKSISE